MSPLAVSAIVLRHSDVEPAMCGVNITLGALNIGLSGFGGSPSKTSSAAPARRFSVRALANSTSLIKLPRAQLIMNEVGFILEKKSFKSIAKKRDLLDLCDDLLSTKGAAFGITLARDILFRYQNLSEEEKNKFLIDVNEKYKPDPSKIDEAIKRYSDKQDDYSILNLSRVTSGIRKELFVILNMAPNGTSEIVSLLSLIHI